MRGIEIDGVNVILTAVRAHANRTEALKASVRIKEKLTALPTSRIFPTPCAG